MQARDEFRNCRNDVAALEPFKAFFSDLKVEGVAAKAKQVYADKLYFNDTVKTLRDNETLAAYLEETGHTVDANTVLYDNAVYTGDGFFVQWRMQTKLTLLGSQREINTIGVSHIRLDCDGRVILHQDYWDSASGIYEHIPALGGMIRYVKSRL